MTLVIKMMGSANKADDNTSKPYSLIPVPDGFFPTFVRESDGRAFLRLNNMRGVSSPYQQFPVVGNCYVLQNGETISCFAVSNYSDNNRTGSKLEIEAEV